MRLQYLFQSEMGEEKAVPDAFIRDQSLRYCPIFLSAYAPLDNLFGNVNHGYIQYRVRGRNCQ